MTTQDDGVTSDAPDEGAVAEAGPGDAGEAVAEASELDTEPEYDILELDDELAAKHVPIKQDGEIKYVPLREALDGYNASSVATQRFQEAAKIREQAEQALRLEQAFRANPGLTVQVLAQQAGMTVEEFVGLTPAQQQAAVEDGGSEDDEYLDPLEREVRSLRSMIEAQQMEQQRREADSALQGAVSSLKQAYQASDDEVRQVVQTALQMNLGIEAFPMIYQSLAFQATQQAQAQHTAEQEAEEQRRRQAAAKANQIVGDTTSVSESSQVRTDSRQINTPREAALAAFESFGM